MSPPRRTSSAGNPPLPPADLANRDLPLRTLDPTPLYRIHRNGREPIFFGPPTEEPESRFDDPQGQYKVCYLGLSPASAFVETLLREPAGQLVALAVLQERHLASIQIVQTLKLVDFDGPGLHALGATLEVLGTRDYSLPGAWSRALHDHPGQPDGICYPCRHDNREYAVALFDRARAALSNPQSRPLLDDPGFLADMARTYQFGIG